MSTDNIPSARGLMNPSTVHRMSLDDALAAFEASKGLLDDEALKEVLQWQELSRVSYFACTVSQHIHLLTCQQRRRSDMPCDYAMSLMDGFVTAAETLLNRESPPSAFASFVSHIDHIRDRHSDIFKLAERAAARDDSLGFETTERARPKSQD